MALRYGEDFAGSDAGGRATARRSTIDDVDGHASIPAGHVLGSAQIAVEHGGPAHRRLRRLQAPAGSDLRAVRAGPLRRLHHRGDLRPAGLPPSRRRATRSASCCARSRSFPSAPIWSAPMRSARPAGDPAAARRRLRQADLSPRRAGASSATIIESQGIDLGDLRAGHRRDRRQGTTSPAPIVLGPPSAIADRWARRFPDPVAAFASAGCGSAPAPASAASSCR